MYVSTHKVSTSKSELHLTMASECDVSERIVTQFLLNTCGLCPRVSKHDVQAALVCGWTTTELRLYPEKNIDKETETIPLITGSVAEFYIEPMLPLAGDIDVMYYWNFRLAIPRGHPPPTQLPSEFNNYVRVHEIIDSELRGYVYLELHYLLTQCTDDGKYNCVEYDELGHMLSNDWDTGRHGPAVVISQKSGSSLLDVDQVRCERCLVWPLQAADWPARHRNYGWPDSATLDRVVSNGCDVVGVAHRHCRHNGWTREYHWRLSFSRAEIVLINSWMPVQQIVYHMLRYFMKTKQLTDCADDSGASTLSNYHIKTLMLWACELK